MPLRTQTVPIPLGGGLKEDEDGHRRNPPHADVANRAVVRNDGGYQKAPGWTSLGGGGFTGSGGGKILAVSSQDSLMQAGQDNCVTYDVSKSIWRPYGDGFISPIGVSSKNVLSLRGQIVDIGIAHHQASGYTAIYAKHLDSLKNANGQCVALVIDSNGLTVAGPYFLDDATYFPRVEAVTDAGGNPTFLFFALDRIALAYTGTYDLTCFAIDMAAVPVAEPTVTTIAANVNTPNAIPATGRKHLYDTHSVSSELLAYVTYYNGNEVVCLSVNDAGAIVTTATVKVGTPGALQVFHDEVSETVLVSESGTWNSIFYANEALGGFAEVAGVHAETSPMLYKHADGSLYFSGELISLTGSAPATPSFTGTASYEVGNADTRDAQGWVGHSRVMVFENFDGGIVTGGAGGGITGVRTGWFEGSSLYAYFIGDDDDLLYPTVPIMQTRHSPYVPDGFLTPPSAVGQVGHVPQSARDASGRVLLASHTRSPATRAWPFISQTDESYFEGHDPNQDHSVQVITLSPLPADIRKSVLEHRGTTVIASGGIHAWDGQSFFDIPGPPLITEYDDSATPGTGALRSDYSELDDTGLGTYTHIGIWAMRVVLVFTDRNGVEWRSAPSPIFTVDGVDGNTASQLPMIKLFLDNTHLRIMQEGGGILDGGGYDVELYVTERDNGSPGGSAGAATEADLIYDFYLAQRTPLQWDPGNSVLYIPDLLKFSYGGNNDRTPFQLYTDSAELAPVRPPATSVMAQAGGYMFLVPDEFPDELWPSKPLEAGRGPEWAPELIVQAPSGSGGIVSLGSVGDQLIVLGRYGVYELFAGSGPDATGAGGFGAMRLLHQGNGCTTHAATVSTPMGVFYATSGGIRLVTRQGTVEDVGAPVQASIGDTLDIVSATYRDNEQEVWFHRNDGVCFVFNLSNATWTTVQRVIAGAAPLDAAVSGDRVHHVIATGLVYKEDESIGNDEASLSDSSDYTMDIKTSWLTFDKNVSYFRCRRVHFTIRDRGGNADIIVELRYDYDDTVVDSFRFKDGGASGWQSFERPGHFTVRPSRQKFDAIQIRVYEDGPTSTDGFVEATQPDLMWDLTGLELEVATKQGGIKLQQAAKH